MDAVLSSPGHAHSIDLVCGFQAFPFLHQHCRLSSAVKMGIINMRSVVPDFKRYLYAMQWKNNRSSSGQVSGVSYSFATCGLLAGKAGTVEGRPVYADTMAIGPVIGALGDIHTSTLRRNGFRVTIHVPSGDV